VRKLKSWYLHKYFTFDMRIRLNKNFIEPFYTSMPESTCIFLWQFGHKIGKTQIRSFIIPNQRIEIKLI